MQKQRARSEEEKALRKQSIIDALAQLMLQGHSLPSAGDIAKQANITKGVIYRYFDSREEIFLTLLIQVSAPLNGLASSNYANLNEFKQQLLDFFNQQPLFMQLSVQAPVVLEQNISSEFARSFKLAGADLIDTLASCIHQFAPELTSFQRRQFIYTLYQLAQAKWQSAHPPRAIQEAFADHSHWLVNHDMRQEMSDVFDWLWYGLRYLTQQANVE
ncbi:TetR family transcriptional regulator [Teredinibacter sp. KSP-S5-2]|uniref:TetR family transcriptional regulator n=1 Tax=Teredinibacter sp. KSP-S5-2 TaxID=3034506 RepID=UPI002934DA2F|nr:TetR family transcriptional regulator [Teredinibacter sp. KSP-S5-2]WNO10678.1 TetR family transcriptional regulator [Teredinibacter sp. KSP-S5-2]